MHQDDTWRVWNRLEDLERHLRSPYGVGHARFDSVGRPARPSPSYGWSSIREQLSRVERVRRALRDSGPEAQELLAQQFAGLDLPSISAVLVQACQDVALYYGGSVLAGAALGGVGGAFLGGVGAVPGAAAGAALGSQVGGWWLAFLGLQSLAEDLVDTLPAALRHYERGFREAWGPTPHEVRHDALGLGQGHGNAHFAAGELAQGHVLLVGALLAALAAWLTRGRGNRAQVLQEIRSSPRLGPRVAQWLEQHEEALRQHPALQSRRHPEAGTAGTGGGLPPELPRETAAGGRGGRDGAKPLARETKVPCFHPFDKKKFAQMGEAERKGYLKEMSDQLQRQQDQINSLSAVEYKAARDAFQSVGRNPLAEGTQASYRERFAAGIRESIRDSLSKGGLNERQARTEATSRTKELMGKLSALHEPDMVAGGWMQPAPKGMGRADVNSSIGASWNQEGRIASMDAAAEEVIRNGKGNEKMNVKLEPCRGKGMR